MTSPRALCPNCKHLASDASRVYFAFIGPQNCASCGALVQARDAIAVEPAPAVVDVARGLLSAFLARVIKPHMRGAAR